MTEQETEGLLARLERRLGLDEPEEELLALMVDELMDAENELKLYLNLKVLPGALSGKVVELAAVFFRRDRCEEEQGKSSSSYTEGQISQTDHYFSPKEYRAAVSEILDSVARYRRVVC